MNVVLFSFHWNILEADDSIQSSEILMVPFIFCKQRLNCPSQALWLIDCRVFAISQQVVCQQNNKKKTHKKVPIWFMTVVIDTPLPPIKSIIRLEICANKVWPNRVHCLNQIDFVTGQSEYCVILWKFMHIFGTIAKAVRLDSNRCGGKAEMNDFCVFIFMTRPATQTNHGTFFVVRCFCFVLTFSLQNEGRQHDSRCDDIIVVAYRSPVRHICNNKNSR